MIRSTHHFLQNLHSSAGLPTAACPSKLEPNMRQKCRLDSNIKRNFKKFAPIMQKRRLTTPKQAFRFKRVHLLSFAASAQYVQHDPKMDPEIISMPETSIRFHKNCRQIRFGGKDNKNSSQTETDQVYVLKSFLVPTSKMAPRGPKRPLDPQNHSKKMKWLWHFVVCISAFVSAFVA